MLAAKICCSRVWERRAAFLIFLLWAVAALSAGATGAGTTTWNAEDLDRIRISNGTAGIQEMTDFTTGPRVWNGGAQLWWTGATPGDELVLGFDVASAGTYSISLVLTKASDYGIVSVSVDGVVLNASIDLYSTDVEPMTILVTSSTALSAGGHELRFAIVGKNANAVANYMVGIDTVAVEFLSASTGTSEGEPSGDGSGTAYEEDFEDGQAQGWQLPDANWEVVRDGEDYVLCGKGANLARYQWGSWTDCTLEMRAKLVHSGVNISFRTNGCDRYFVGLSEGAVDLYKTNPCGIQTRLATRAGTYALMQWHEVKIAYAGGAIEVSVDGARVIAYTDSAPLPTGQIALESFPDSEVYVDDIVVGTEPHTSAQTQAPAETCVFAVTEGIWEFEPAGGEGQLTISTEARCAWTVSSPCEWVHITPEGGRGTGEVTVTVDENASGSDRSCVLTIAGRSVEVHQGWGLPDLDVRVMGACVRTTPARWPGFDVPISVTVANLGAVSSPDVSCSFDFLDATGQVFGQGMIASNSRLAAGDTITLDYTFSATWYAGMFPLQIQAELDPSNAITETDESNNRWDSLLKLTDVCAGGLPDLVVTSIDACLEVYPALWPDFSVPISVTVTNIGTAASPACMTGIGMAEAAGAPIAYTTESTPGLAPGDVVVLESGLAATWGVYMFPVRVTAAPDIDGVVAEQDEQNEKEVSLKLTDVCAGSLPDLDVTSIDACLQTTAAQWPSFSVPISVKVKNIGGGPSPSCEGAVTLLSAAGLLVDSETFSAAVLAPGASLEGHVTISTTWHTGMFPMLIVAEIDSQKAVAEADETNNNEEESLKLTHVCAGSLPDLDVTSIDACLQTTPATWPSFSVPITVKVKNVGAGPSVSCKGVVELRTASGQLVDSQTFSAASLAPGASLDGHATISTTWQAGMFPMLIVAEIDPQDAVAEGNENNNKEDEPLKLTDVCP